MQNAECEGICASQFCLLLSAFCILAPTMPKPLNTVLAQIAQGKPPAVILVGGSSEYLSEQAFHDIRDAIVAKQPGIAARGVRAGRGARGDPRLLSHHVALRRRAAAHRPRGQRVRLGERDGVAVRQGGRRLEVGEDRRKRAIVRGEAAPRPRPGRRRSRDDRPRRSPTPSASRSTACSPTCSRSAAPPERRRAAARTTRRC